MRNDYRKRDMKISEVSRVEPSDWVSGIVRLAVCKTIKSKR